MITEINSLEKMCDLMCDNKLPKKRITKEEAIETLTAIRDEATEDEHSVCYVTSEDADALNMAIEALNNVTDKPNDVIESENDVIKSNNDTTDLISRQDAIDILDEFESDIEVGKRDSYKTHREKLLSVHSAYHPLCALADRECPFQGKEYAWCLTCPHISEEDRALVKKAVEEPKTGTWKKISPAIICECSECGQMVMTGDIESYKFCHGCGARMKNGYE